MNGETLTEKLTKTPHGMRSYQQERTILEVTELLCELMNEASVTRTELAKRMGKSKGHVTQLLDGRTNMTLRTISDAMLALGQAVHFRSGPLEATATRDAIFSFHAAASWEPQTRTWHDDAGSFLVPCTEIQRIAS